jgi:hypothetical protein
MAGMFYSMQEAAEKLNKTEEDLKELVTEGKLREFRDGPNVLFKVEEIEALMSDADVIGPQEVPEAEAPELEAPLLEVSEPEEAEAEMPMEEIPEPDIGESEVPELEALDTGISELEIPETEPEVPEMAEPEVPMGSEDATGTSEILLAPETGAPVMPSDLTDADTALTGMGTSVLGETDQDYDITDDTLAETAVPTGTAPEVPLEEIEEDVNLDSFGSGSGLLDLSLQADDTSLGGILDEIYTAEGEGQEPVEAEAEGSAGAMAAEADQMVAEEEIAAPQAMPEVSALAAPLIEVPPDAQSNTLGMLLFLPLIIVIYTTVVAVAGFKGVIPSILGTVQSFIWYIMGGAAVLTALVVGAGFLLTGERGTAVKKEKKPKKVKKPKEPKAAKPKKEKKPKKPKKAK